jgi:integrative and conjugative element protein (TIGR02256 family)
VQPVIERVIFPAALRASVDGHIAARPDRETGGILVGTRAGDVVTIARVSPPGPRAVHRRFWFSRDTGFLQRWLDEEYDRTDGVVDYVGEWHVHPQLDTPPSCIDRRSLWKIARKSNYATDHPILLIVENEPPERRFRVYGFEVKPRKQWAELPVSSSAD